MPSIQQHLVIALFSLSPLAAQDIPIHQPITPLLASRSALYSQPLIRARPGWHLRTLLDYSSVVDVAASGSRDLVLDAELLTADLWLTHDLSPRTFLLANIAVRGAYNGALDEAINSYHHATGLLVPARDRLPVNTYDWHAIFPDTIAIYERPDAFLGDLRLGIGWRVGRSQLVASLTVPTATVANDGWSRKTVATSFAFATPVYDHGRLQVEGGGSIGWTPATGPLARYQRENFTALNSSLRYRFSGRQAMYGTLWIEQGVWKDTGFRAMDNLDVTLDFGVLLRLGGRWPEIQLGMTEDLYPNGPAVDVGFRSGVRW